MGHKIADIGITIRGYLKGDENGVGHLLHDSFSDTLDPESIKKIWLWQFRNEFSMHSGVGLAEYNSKIIGHRSIMWFDMNYKGRTIKGGIQSASATDSNFRRMGISSGIGEKLYQDVAKDDCEIVYAFSNKQNIDLNVRKLGFSRMNSFPISVKPVNFSSLIGRFFRGYTLPESMASWVNQTFQSIGKAIGHYSTNSTFKLVASEKIPYGAGELWKSGFISNKLSIIRNRQYLNWRYIKRPFFSYKIYAVYSERKELLGYFITHLKEKFGLKILFVMELVVRKDSQNVCRHIISCLDRLANDHGADAVSMFLQRNNPNYRLFLRGGFIPVPQALFPQDIFFSVKSLSQKIHDDYVIDTNNWYLSWGDLDVV